MTLITPISEYFKEIQDTQMKYFECYSCKSYMDEPHILLPCFHIFCQNCSVGKYLGKCIVCDDNSLVIFLFRSLSPLKSNN